MEKASDGIVARGVIHQRLNFARFGATVVAGSGDQEVDVVGGADFGSAHSSVSQLRYINCVTPDLNGT